MRLLLPVFIVLGCALTARVGMAASLEAGLAITDPLALRTLDRNERQPTEGLDFGVGHIFAPAQADHAPMTNDALFALPSMAPVRRALEAGFDRYIARRRSEGTGESIGIGPPFAVQLFARDVLFSSRSRFVLSGIVNRMDRAYVAPATCGEIRLIYRLTRIGGKGTPDTSPRLPMTLNVIVKAKDERQSDVTCADIARRWLATATWPQTGADLAIRLMSPEGPLALLKPSNVVQIETNLQIAHMPKSATQDFRTDYLLKMFNYDRATQTFREAPLENQIDRERLLGDRALATAFRRWLLAPDHLAAFDRGTLILPSEFLATAAVAPTPVGFAPSDLQPAFGLVGSDDDKAAVFRTSDVVTALNEAAANGAVLQNIRSVAGFARRLNDITCAGCHQTRGIGGFHFPGVDWMAAKPDNSVVVPASPHFYGDQARRRDILAAFRDGRSPDFSRGFSDRPQLRGDTRLLGTEYNDGWGAHCYDSGGGGGDRSFRSWTCATGLACQVTGAATTTSHMGMCFVGTR